jgi:hypothetical protein
VDQGETDDETRENLAGQDPRRTQGRECRAGSTVGAVRVRVWAGVPTTAAPAGGMT